MRYLGSKNKLSKRLLPLISGARKPGQLYVEPFVGGANMIDKIDGRRLGNDRHGPLIEMWRALQAGWVPPEEVTKEMYYAVKECPSAYPPGLVGFVGFLCSFGGKWWGGYAKNTARDNYAARGCRQLLKQKEFLKDVAFTNFEYWNLPLPPGEASLIYCDPPYEGTTKYSGDGFNHTSFWDWVRTMAREGHTMFVSEYSAPSDFLCVAEIPHKTILDKNSQKPRIEKLFVPVITP